MTSETLETAEKVLGQPLARELRMKALGGIGCWLHVRDHGPEAAPFRRDYGDVDLVVPKSGGKRIGEVMRAADLTPVESFNANGGANRRMFVSAGSSVQVDVFIGGFVMCHEVPLADCAFVPADHPALGVTELLLTKLQVVELSDKDANDASSLLAFHEVGTGPEQIDGDRIAELLASDWGLWRTVTANLERMAERVRQQSPLARGDVVVARVGQLRCEIERAKKSLKWRARAKVGDRVQWYAEPEEPVKEWIAVR
ncbi:MAG TPA: hypothetical protein VHX62_10770 [Solirubrobacteraceae bacterium]|jgi:hypothetical protein|nr:hypothetical protein [Solirubrobacteraceae bacterium]